MVSNLKLFLGDLMLNKEELAHIPDEELFQMAIEEHQQNAAYGLGSDRVYTPEGEVYFIYDEDAGL